jgi:hypothetical protein
MFFQEKVQNVEMKSSWLKMKENKQEEIFKLEAKLELALSRQKNQQQTFQKSFSSTLSQH